MGNARPYLVEGIGEDIVPTAFEHQYVDDMITVSDMNSFAMTRRLSREEGLMVGGSSGSAAHVAFEIARSLDKNKLVVVLLPDSGERYLSKVHSDEWMRENRMLGRETFTVGELLRSKSTDLPPVAYVGAGETVIRAVELMKSFGVTQMPVKRGADWVGKVTEGDLLDQLLAGRVTGDEQVGNVMAAPFPMLSAGADRADVLRLFSQGHMAVLVADESGTVGIVTKSDLVDQMLEGLE
jgi:cystathionine beta-synthase